jgi:hypothetical protein
MSFFIFLLNKVKFKTTISNNMLLEKVGGYNYVIFIFPNREFISI